MNYLLVEAEPRYTEDATINGTPDDDGILMPFLKDGVWRVVINLDKGFIENWPKNTTANVHYKVCDQGLYWLLDDDFNKVYQYNGSYVPSDYLCHGGSGYGDYIIMKIDGEGHINNYVEPSFDAEYWTKLED